MKQFFLFMSLTFSIVTHDEKDLSRIVYFSKSSPIEKSSTNCGNLKTALIYAFALDKDETNSSLFYGLIICPEMFDQKLFVYDKKLKIKYKNINKKVLDNLLILNQHKYRDKKFYLITDIKNL